MSIEADLLRQKQLEQQYQQDRLTHVLTVLEASCQLKGVPQRIPLVGKESLSLTEKFGLVLHDILTVHNVDTSEWGKGDKKTFAELVDDVQKGERIPNIYNSELIWDVERIRFGVFYHNEEGWWMLGDGIQVYDWPDQRGNPRIRYRTILGMREKVKPGERKKLKKAVLRMILEESGEELVIFDTARVIFIEHKPENPDTQKRPKESKTYPGLTSNAILHKGLIIITDDDFVNGKSFKTCQVLPEQFDFPNGISRKGFPPNTRGFVEKQTEGKKEEHKTCYVFWKKVAEGDLPDYFHKYVQGQYSRRSVRNT